VKKFPQKSHIFWYVTPCSLLKVNAGSGKGVATILRTEEWGKLRLLPVSCWFIALLTLQPSRWRRHASQKHRLIFDGLHGFIHSPIRLHGVVLNYLSTEPTLHFTWHYIIEDRALHNDYSENISYCQRFRKLHGTRMFPTVFTWESQWTLSRASSVLPTPSHCVFLYDTF
jgi:hypothetical protein